jgi:TonB family protein
MHRYPGLFADPRTRGLKLALAASVLLHAALFSAFGRFHIRPPDRTFYAPVQVVDLGNGGPAQGRSGASPAPPPPKVEKPAPKESETQVKEVPKPPEPKPKKTREAKAETPEAKKLPAAKEAPPKRAESKPKEVPTRDAEARVADRIAKLREQKQTVSEEKVSDRVAKLREKLAESRAESRPPAGRSEGDVQSAINSIRQRVAVTGGGGGSGAVGVRGGGNVLQEVRLRAYYNQLWEHVNQYWTIPPSLQGKDLTAIISAVVDRQGRVLKSWVEEASGTAAFDQSALRALERATPLPAMPDSVTGDTLEIGFRFHGD